MGRNLTANTRESKGELRQGQGPVRGLRSRWPTRRPQRQGRFPERRSPWPAALLGRVSRFGSPLLPVRGSPRGQRSQAGCMRRSPLRDMGRSHRAPAEHPCPPARVQEEMATFALAARTATKSGGRGRQGRGARRLQVRRQQRGEHRSEARRDPGQRRSVAAWRRHVDGNAAVTGSTGALAGGAAGRRPVPRGIKTRGVPGRAARKRPLCRAQGVKSMPKALQILVLSEPSNPVHVAVTPHP